MKLHRYIPYGYTVRNGRTIIEHTEAGIVKEIFREYINGASLKEIANSLTERRIPYTEKTDVWDKARIARIIDNARYIGTEEYDAIVDENTFEVAVKTKIARQTSVVRKECEGISTLRNRVKCEKCDSLMVHRICSKYKIKESWTCSDPECGCRVRISDSDLLTKVTLLLNRIIRNSSLIIPKDIQKEPDSLDISKYKEDISKELKNESPSEEFIISRIFDIANAQYKQSNSKEMITAHIVKKRISLMQPQDEFNCLYFTDLVAYITMDDKGTVKLHTKTNTLITEGDVRNGCNQDT